MHYVEKVYETANLSCEKRSGEEAQTGSLEE